MLGGSIFQNPLKIFSRKVLTIRVTQIIIKVTLKGGDGLEVKRRGRPTDNPKPYRIAVKMDEGTKRILDSYCKQEGVNQMEAARRGIKKLAADLKDE